MIRQFTFASSKNGPAGVTTRSQPNVVKAGKASSWALVAMLMHSLQWGTAKPTKSRPASRLSSSTDFEAPVMVPVVRSMPQWMPACPVNDPGSTARLNEAAIGIDRVSRDFAVMRRTFDKATVPNALRAE